MILKKGFEEHSEVTVVTLHTQHSCVMINALHLTRLIAFIRATHVNQDKVTKIHELNTKINDNDASRLFSSRVVDRTSPNISNS